MVRKGRDWKWFWRNWGIIPCVCDGIEGADKNLSISLPRQSFEPGTCTALILLYHARSGRVIGNHFRYGMHKAIFVRVCFISRQLYAVEWITRSLWHRRLVSGLFNMEARVRSRQSKWDLWWTMWKSDRFSSEYFLFPRHYRSSNGPLSFNSYFFHI